MSNWPLSSSFHRGRKNPTDKARTVSKRRRIMTNWNSGRTLQTSTESVGANFSVPSEVSVEGQVSGLGTVHLLLTFDFTSSWFLPLCVNLRTLSSVEDGLQKRLYIKCYFSEEHISSKIRKQSEHKTKKTSQSKSTVHNVEQ